MDFLGAPHQGFLPLRAGKVAVTVACLIPSVTKVKVVSPFTITSCGRWVSTNTGLKAGRFHPCSKTPTRGLTHRSTRVALAHERNVRPLLG